MRWNTKLAKEWMGLRPEAEPMFYVDGHVRVYHGKEAQLHVTEEVFLSQPRK